ncbi:MAG: alkaline phosphatase family protein [Opitutaceae bacterium]|nr:alkaline phosphatase family protein [Opitutaceae bacterium]
MPSSFTGRAWFACRTGAILSLALAALQSARAQPGPASPPPGEGNPRPRLVLVVVVDGLRPDLISAATTPTLDRLRREGVEYLNAHSAFPTVTRVNAAVLVTGAHPRQTGITSNTLYDRRLNGGQPFNTGLAENLWPLAEIHGGRMISPVTLGEVLTSAGLSFAAISSGSTGQAILLNSQAKAGSGMVINGAFEGGRRTAYPNSVDEAIKARFGLKPAGADADSLEWTERVLREFVLPEVKPAVLIDWVTEPDHTQHKAGVGSPATLAAIRRADESIAKTLATLEASELLRDTAIIVTADHGFIAHEQGINVTDALIQAGLKQSRVSRDVIITSDSQSVQFFVENREAKKIRAIVEFLQTQAWSDGLFVDATAPLGAPATNGPPGGVPPVEGWLPGTFSLQLVHLAPLEGRPDIVLTLPWRSEKNAFGHSGLQTANRAAVGPVTGHESGHGGMSPWVLRTPLLLWGRHFKERCVVGAPAGNVDITPTVLALMGLAPPQGASGRVLREAFRGGPDEQKLRAESRVHEVNSRHGFRAAIQLSASDGRWYLDKCWRIQ